MTHDTLCMDHGLPAHISTHDCACDEYAKVREDERQAAVHRVEALYAAWSPAEPHGEEVIAAIKGESND